MGVLGGWDRMGLAKNHEGYHLYYAEGDEHKAA